MNLDTARASDADPSPEGGRRGGIRRTLRRRGLLPRPRVLRALTRLAQNLPTRGNRIDLHHDGDTLFASMLDDIRAARQRVWIEMYMFLSDATGWRFAEALAERARAGVDVRVIYDSLGSFGTSQRLWRTLTDAGAKVLEYRPLAPWRKRFAIFGRNHRKIMAVDGRISYTGGVNIGDPWVSRRRGGQNWRDAQVRIEGPATSDFEVLFADTWYRETGSMLLAGRTRREEARDGRDRGITNTAAGGDDNDDDAGCQVYVIGGGLRCRRIRRLHLLAAGHARRRIRILCAYFVPDRKFQRALFNARSRGIEVDVLLPKRSDVPITLAASRALFARFLRHDIRIFQYRPHILHAKATVVDGYWTSLGSANLDSLSFYFNLEANVVILSHETGGELEERFLRDQRRADPVDPVEWQRRPWNQKFIDRLALLFGRWL